MCQSKTDNPDPNGFLDEMAFARVIRGTPLVSIHLIVRDKRDCFLVGLRKHEPAKQKFFVLSGRILKDEFLDDAFRRITRAELQVEIERKNASFIGVFEHHYKKANLFETPGFGTHCVVLAYELVVAERPQRLNDQHTQFEWWTKDEILASPQVHPNTKAYFHESMIRSEKQYEILSYRRNSTNTMLWQVPALCLTAMAFLLSVVGNKDTIPAVRVATSFLGLLIAIATLQLFVRHRMLETRDAIWLEQFEIRNRHLGYATINERPYKDKSVISGWKYWKSNVLWRILFWVFIVVSLILVGYSIRDYWAAPTTSPTQSTYQFNCATVQPPITTDDMAYPLSTADSVSTIPDTLTNPPAEFTH